jgi:hypothetical protein
VLLAGASILAVVVGAALIGRDPSRDARATVVSAAASATADGVPVPAQPEVLVHGRTAGATPHVIVLESPATQFEATTSGDLIVRGHLVSGTGPVLVVLQSSGGTTITGKTVGPMTMPRPGVDPSPPFEVRLALPDPRPSDTMTLEVVAYDINGIPVDAIRRPIRIADAAGDPFPKP